MAARKTGARLRIAVALVIIALAAASFLMIWSQEEETWVRVVDSMLPALLLFIGATILYGKTRAGRLVLTRRHWKYYSLIGVVVGVAILVAALSLISPDRLAGNPALALFPAIIGLFGAQLYEPENTPQFKVSGISDRDANAWKRIALISAIIGIVLACISGISGMAGSIDAIALLMPIAVLSLAATVAIWTMLRMRNRQLKMKP